MISGPDDNLEKLTLPWQVRERKTSSVVLERRRQPEFWKRGRRTTCESMGTPVEARTQVINQPPGEYSQTLEIITAVTPTLTFQDGALESSARRTSLPPGRGSWSLTRPYRSVARKQ